MIVQLQQPAQPQHPEVLVVLVDPAVGVVARDAEWDDGEEVDDGVERRRVPGPGCEVSAPGRANAGSAPAPTRLYLRVKMTTANSFRVAKSFSWPGTVWSTPTAMVAARDGEEGDEARQECRGVDEVEEGGRVGAEAGAPVRGVRGRAVQAQRVLRSERQEGVELDLQHAREGAAHDQFV